MGEVKGYLGGDLIIKLVVNERQQHYLALRLNIIPEELVERRHLLIFVDLEFMVFVVD